MRDRIKLSKISTDRLDSVKRNLRLSGEDYIPMRIAWGRSMQSAVEPEVPVIKGEKAKASSAKEVQLSTFEQQEGLLFKALTSQRYQRKIEGSEYIKILTQHIEHGLWLIAKDNERLKGYDYIMMITNATNLHKEQNSEDTNLVNELKAAADVVNVRIGLDKKSKQPIEYAINVANNPHFAIIGGTGAGKTYFLKHLLTEIRKASDYHTHFVIFDYKDGDIAKDKNFIQQTSASVIDVNTTPLPLNIFAGAKNGKEQKRRAERIVEIIKNVEANIGKVQEENLYNAIVKAYKSEKPYPDFGVIREELKSINPKPDSLTSVLRPLVEQGYFATKEQQIYGSWLKRTLIVDIHEIERKELICFFILNQIYQELKTLGNAPVNANTQARKLRIVVVIDEAHYFLQNAKRAKILEKMIREVRSSGGVVILASQSPDDYNQSDFNFLELMQFPIVLNSTPSSHKFLEQKFALSAKEAKSMMPELAKLERGEAYVLVDNEMVVAELCK